MVAAPLRSLGVLAVVCLVAACANTAPSPPAATPPPAVLVPTPAPSAAASAPSSASLVPSPAASVTEVPLPRPLADSGTIALVGRDGGLAVLAADGRSLVLDQTRPAFVFPAWSPDGTRLAAVRQDPTGTTTIEVYPALEALDGGDATPDVIFRNPTIQPFYLSWTPDGDAVSYLASDATGLALRIAPANASSPTDGTEASSIIRVGEPFYFDWVARDDLVAHVGTGEEAFLGPIDRSGDATAQAIARPAAFRSPAVSPDGRFVAYAQVTDDGSRIVVAPRDGGSGQTMPIAGMSAISFDPSGTTLAALGPAAALETTIALPFGPIRLLDPASGDARTLLDGTIVSFWWSPDGSTIAAIDAVPVGGGSDANVPHLLFVDVESGEIRSDTVIQPAQLYVDQFLTFFDQYALSHHVWSPDGSSFLMPIIDDDNLTSVGVFFPNGDPPVMLAGQMGFWTPPS